MSINKRSDGSYFETTYEQGEYYVELKSYDGNTIDGFSKPLDYTEAIDLIALLNRSYDSGVNAIKPISLEVILEVIQSYISTANEALSKGSTLTTIDSVLDALNDIRTTAQLLEVQKRLGANS